jgi:hypothetical protein
MIDGDGDGDGNGDEKERGRSAGKKAFIPQFCCCSYLPEAVADFG